MKKLLSTLLLSIIVFATFAQGGPYNRNKLTTNFYPRTYMLINDTSGTTAATSRIGADSSAVIIVRDTTRGVLLPRMTGAQAAAIANKSHNLLVVITDSVNKPLCMWDTLNSKFLCFGTTSGNIENIYNISDTIIDDRIVSLDTHYLSLGNPLTEDVYLTIGDLTPFGLTNKYIIGQAENIELYCPIVPDQGFFFGLKNKDTEESEGLFVLQKRVIGETTGSISVYAEDGVVQRARVEIVYDSVTRNSRARLCAYSDTISQQNFIQVKNNGIDINYRSLSTGLRFNISFNDDEIVIQSDSIVYLRFDTLGNIVSPSVLQRNFTDDVNAAAGGVPVGGFYHNAGAMRIREN